jgi:hypothetical protein
VAVAEVEEQVPVAEAQEQVPVAEVKEQAPVGEEAAAEVEQEVGDATTQAGEVSEST